MEFSSSAWRVCMELLSNVHTLRLYLLPSSPQVRPAQDFTGLEVDLISAPPALSCSWKATREAGGTCSLRLLLPLLLFDYDSPPRISALSDCFQVTVHLLPLPPTRPLHSSSSLTADGAALRLDDSERNGDDAAHQRNGIQAGLFSQASAEHGICCNDAAPQSLEYDCAQEGILSMNIGTHTGISCGLDSSNQVLQAPLCSKDDSCHGCRDDIDNNTGFADGENVQQRFLSDCHHHECGHFASSALHDSASAYSSATIERMNEDFSKTCANVTSPPGTDNGFDQLTREASLCFQQKEEEIPTHSHPMQLTTGAIEVSRSSFLCQHKLDAADNLHGAVDNLASDSYRFKRGLEDSASMGSVIFVCNNCLSKVSRKPVRNVVKLPCFDWREVAENWFGACCCSFGSTAEFLSARFEKSVQLEPGKCLVGPSTFYVEFSDVVVKKYPDSSNIRRTEKQWPTSYFLAFGNGFMVRDDQVSKFTKWLPVQCANCASLIGAYPYTSTDAGSSKEGLHLFRCKVKISQKDGILNEACCFKTFKDLLVEELRVRSDENLTYRFLIRSLSSELPLLQIVVLNYDALICTDRVTVDFKKNRSDTSEATSLDTEVKLQQSMKVLFLDCTIYATDDLISAEVWVKEHDAETVYMLEEFADRLREELFAHSRFCPADCGLFQNFKSSFLFTKGD